MAMYGSVDSHPGVGLRPTPRATRQVAFFLAGLALVAVVAIGMLASSDQSTELLQMRRTKSFVDRVHSLHSKVMSQSKLQRKGPPTKGEDEEKPMEEAAHDLSKAGTEYSHEMDEIESACHQELTEFENAIAVDDPEIAHMNEDEMMIAHASYMIFKMMDKDESGCIDHHEYFEMLEVIHKEEPEACNGELDFICGTHFDAEGNLNKHGAEEDFDHIDEDKSGYLSINEVANLVYHVISEHMDHDGHDHDGHHGSGDHHDYHGDHHGSGDHHDYHDYHGDHIHCANGRC
jgi:Ca2+-binding EF-hand superfamily protein